MFETILQLILPSIAIALSIYTYYDSRENTKKLQSKEHEVSEDFKSECLKMVLALHSIKNKIIAPREIRNYNDILVECKMLEELRLEPGYLLMILALQDKRKRVEFDQKLQNIIDLKQLEEKTDVPMEFVGVINDIFDILLDNIDNFTSKAKLENLDQISDFIDRKRRNQKQEKRWN